MEGDLFVGWVRRVREVGVGVRKEAEESCDASEEGEWREERRWCRWPCIERGYGEGVGVSKEGEVGDFGEEREVGDVGEVGEEEVGDVGEEEVGEANGSYIPFPAPSHPISGK